LLDQDTLLWSNGIMVEVGLQVLVKSLSALLGRSGLNAIGYPDPIASIVDGDEMQEHLILLL
jgi:hypothetical protein